MNRHTLELVDEFLVSQNFNLGFLTEIGSATFGFQASYSSESAMRDFEHFRDACLDLE